LGGAKGDDVAGAAARSKESRQHDDQESEDQPSCEPYASVRHGRSRAPALHAPLLLAKRAALVTRDDPQKSQPIRRRSDGRSSPVARSHPLKQLPPSEQANTFTSAVKETHA
jgi:hypothetical protein